MISHDNWFDFDPVCSRTTLFPWIVTQSAKQAALSNFPFTHQNQFSFIQ